MTFPFSCNIFLLINEFLKLFFPQSREPCYKMFVGNNMNQPSGGAGDYTGCCRQGHLVICHRAGGKAAG